MASYVLNSLTVEHISKRFKLSPDLIYFQGHFPDFPVLPAVGFLKLSHFMIEEETSQKLTLLKAESWRFKQPFKPHQDVLFEAILIEGSGPDESSNTDLSSKTITYRVSWTLIGPDSGKITEGLLVFLHFSNFELNYKYPLKYELS